MLACCGLRHAPIPNQHYEHSIKKMVVAVVLGILVCWPGLLALGAGRH
jgi:hypothetical protein